MSVKYLTYDSAAPNMGTVSVAATFVNGDTIVTLPDHKFLHVTVNSAATKKFTISAMLGSSAVAISTDLDGNSYPRASFTGGCMSFFVPPRTAVKIACTATNMWVKGSR